jgi:type IV pilus assembly protein PilE
MIAKSSGFSLIELLVVIAIVGILAAAGTLTYSGYIDSAKKNSAENIVQQIALAQSEEYANTGSYYITGATDTCGADSTSSQGIEDNLFDGENTIPDDIGFEICTFGTTARFTVSAHQQDGSTCVITVTKYGTPERIGC